MIQRVTVREAKVEPAVGALERDELLLLALAHVAAVLVDLPPLLGRVRGALGVDVPPDDEVRGLVELLADRAEPLAERADGDLDVLAVGLRAGVRVVGEVVLAEDAAAGVALDGEEVEEVAGLHAAVLAEVGELHASSTSGLCKSDAGTGMELRLR